MKITKTEEAIIKMLRSTRKGYKEGKVSAEDLIDGDVGSDITAAINSYIGGGEVKEV